MLKFFETAIISSWPLVVIGLPLTLALGIARGDGLLYYGLGVILFGAFLLLASSFSTLLDFFASFLLRFVRPWLFTVLSLLVLFLAGSGIVGVLVPRASVLEVVFEATNLNDATANTSLISAMFSCTSFRRSSFRRSFLFCQEVLSRRSAFVAGVPFLRGRKKKGGC